MSTPQNADWFRDALREHMDAHGISIASLSRDASYDYSALHKWLSGHKADITFSVAVRLFAAAGLPLSVDA